MLSERVLTVERGLVEFPHMMVQKLRLASSRDFEALTVVHRIGVPVEGYVDERGVYSGLHGAGASANR